VSCRTSVVLLSICALLACNAPTGAPPPVAPHPAPVTTAAPTPIYHPTTAPILSAEEPLRVGGEVLPPKLLKRVTPRFSTLGNIHAHGSGVFEATIDTQGSVTNLRVVRSMGPEFDSLAVSALRQWTFQPATYRGEPVSVYFTLTLTVHFR